MSHLVGDFPSGYLRCIYHFSYLTVVQQIIWIVFSFLHCPTVVSGFDGAFSLQRPCVQLRESHV